MAARTALSLLVALALLSPIGSALDASYDPPVDPPTAEVVKGGGFVVTIEVAQDGTIVVGELEGPVWKLPPGASEPTIIFEPRVLRGNEWGLTGLALAPDFATTGDVYVAYTPYVEGVDPNAADARGTVKVVKVHEKKEQVIYTYVATRGHNGGRLLIHDGLLYIGNGDHKTFTAGAQDPGREEGKILRMTLDGKPAPGNPHDTDPEWHPYAYSMGHRNPFGLAWDATRDRLVESEAGNHSNEEVNIIEPGENFGWPICEGRCEEPRDDFEDAIVVYPKVVTPVGIAVVGRDYYIGTFNTGEVRRIFETPEGWRDEVIYKHKQGLLDVEVSPDGKWLYFGSWNGLFRIPLRERPDGAPTPPTETTPTPTATPSPTPSTEPTPTPTTTPDATTPTPPSTTPTASEPPPTPTPPSESTGGEGPGNTGAGIESIVPAPAPLVILGMLGVAALVAGRRRRP